MKKSISITQKFLCFIALMTCIYSLLIAQNTSWKNNGPYGGHINCLTISKSNPDILYAGTEHGLYKTENGGNSWTKTFFSDFYDIRSIKVHASNPNLIIVGTYRSGVFKSENGGQSWKYMGFWYQTINSMAMDPNNHDALYFGTGEYLSNPTDEYITIYKVFNNWESGKTLKFWENWNVCGWSLVNKIIVDPDSSSWIYAAGVNSGYCSNFGAVLISKNGGNTWEDKKIGSSSTDQVSNIAVVKNSLGETTIFASFGYIYLTSKIKLYKSIDMGETWDEVISPYVGDINPNILTVHPNDPGTLVIGSYNNENPLWIYKNETNTWDYINGNGLPDIISPTCLEIDDKDEKVTYYMATLYGGIFKFNPSENRWFKINTGIDNSMVIDLAVDPNSCSTAFAITQDAYKLNKTSDAGSSWQFNQSNYNGVFDIIRIDPNNSSNIFLAKSTTSYYNLYKSEDNGHTFSNPIEFIECIGNACKTKITDILIKPGDSRSILVSTKPYFLTPGGLTGFGVIARTTDGGTNWDKLIESPGTAMAVDPQNPDVVYIGKERAGQVFKIQNAWSNKVANEITPDGGIENVQDILVDNQSNLFVATEDGLWRRTGETWTKLNTIEVNITTLAIDYSKNPAVLYAGSAGGGIFVSNDSGEKWISFNDGLKNLNIIKLEICNEMLYAATEYGGIWSRTISETTSPPFMTHNTGNLKISVFQNGSFGHAAPNWNYGDGLVYKNNIDPLFNSGLIIGTSDRGYVNGQLGCFGINCDFQNTSPISGFETIPGSWDQVTTSMFNDNTSILPLGLDIVQRSFSNTGEDLLLLKYSINNTTEPKENLYVGLFADWDVGGADFHDHNLGGFDLTRNLAYQYLEGGNPDQNYYGIVALNGISGTRMTGKGNNIYIRDSSYVWISRLNTDVPEVGEYRMWIGSGPYNLDAEENLLVYFAFVVGSNMSDIQANADLAAQKYQELLTGINVKEFERIGFSLGQNYPNPFTRQTEIFYLLPDECYVQFDLINIEGLKIKSLVNKKQIAGKYVIKVETDNLKPGIYFYRLKAGEYAETKKLVIKR